MIAMSSFIQPQHTHSQAGFSLVELIVSLALFSVVVTISVGALLVLIAANDQQQKEQSIMSNLSFALDSMTREMRTGTYYFCDQRPNKTAGGPSGPGVLISGSAGNLFRGGNNLDAILSPEASRDCPSGRSDGGNGNIQGVVFIEAGDSITGSTGSRILYFHERGTGQIFRRVGSEDAQSIVSSGVYIEEVEFFVTGSSPESATGDISQPTITVVVVARDTDDISSDSADPNSKKYRLQTTVTQRALDL